MDWTVEFANHYKVMQFLQLVKLFKMRQVQGSKVSPEVAIEEASKQLMPPDVVQSLLKHQSKNKARKDFMAGKNPLGIYCLTWNQNRSAQALRYAELLPDPDEYNIIAFGA